MTNPPFGIPANSMANAAQPAPVVSDEFTAWFDAFSKAFITQNSTSDEYFLKLKFRTMAEMHDAYDSMMALAMAHKSLTAALAKPTGPSSEEQLSAENAKLREALQRIAEGNLGGDPWQANYEKIRAVAVGALCLAALTEGAAS